MAGPLQLPSPPHRRGRSAAGLTTASRRHQPHAQLHLVGDLGQEVSTLPDGYREALEDVLRDWERRVAACLRLAADADEIPPGSDCAELASFFWVGWEGAILRARLTRDVRPMEVFFAGYLASARIHPGRP
ncbi:TetR family transcriptional regulator C-terminal domain-containing protein [Luteipulveratus halotolerans]|uniref:TetR family transcriptional regulator C-terminal domain-containing protein n=1 Tax=Luteipulveratus halotolerans TaxID=1631356 RepID=UPI0009E52AE7|nr:TetR family transcriptional regulator C-terminal domain-containing protein [Luteipulveratus halotolerans]